MACGSCGQRRAVVSEAHAQAIVANRVRPKYFVQEPDGTETEFEDIFLAKKHQRETSGTLTTTSMHPEVS